MWKPQQQAERILECLGNGTNVLVRTEWASGASVVVQMAIDLAESAGYDVTWIRANQRLSSAQFGALRFAFDDVFKGGPDVVTIVDRISARVGASSRCVLLVEKADMLDSMSVQVLEAAIERSGCHVVAVLSEVAGGGSTPLARWPLDVVEIERRSLTELEGFLNTRVDQSLSDAAIRKVWFQSGGAEDLALVLIDAWARNQGADLNDCPLDARVAAFIGGYFEDLPLPAREILKIVAKDPQGASAKSVIRKFGSDWVDKLLRARLLHREHGDGRLRVIPPAVAMHLRGSDSSDAAAATEEMSVMERISSLLTYDREVEEERSCRRRAAAAERDFVAAPSLANRNTLIEARWARGDDAGSLRELMALDDVPCTSAAAFNYILLRAHWRTHMGESCVVVADELGAKTQGTPWELEGCAEALLLAMSFQAGPVPSCIDEMDEPVWAHHSDGARTASALMLLARGDIARAERALPDLAPDSSIARARWVLTRVFLTLSSSDARHAQQMAEHALLRAVESCDESSTQVLIYALTAISISLGQWNSLPISLLDHIRAKGRAPLLLESVGQQNKCLHVLGIALSGQLQQARDLVRSRQQTVACNAVPIGVPPECLPSIVEAVQSHDHAALAKIFGGISKRASEAGENFAAGYFSAVSRALGYEPSLPSIGLESRRFGAEELWHTTQGDGTYHDRLAIAALRERPLSPSLFLDYLALQLTDHVGDELREVLEKTRVDMGFPQIHVVRGAHASAQLSRREREVAALAGKLSNAEIAQRLNISKRTVDHHISNALRKVGAVDRYELGRYTRPHGGEVLSAVG